MVHDTRLAGAPPPGVVRATPVAFIRAILAAYRRRGMDPAAALAGAARDAEGTPQAPGLRGAIYISCASRGGPHFGAPGAELNSLRHALGDVPLVGLFAAGEIAGRTLHRHTGVLTVFVDEAAP